MSSHHQRKNPMSKNMIVGRKEKNKCIVYNPEGYEPPANLTPQQQDAARYFMHLIETRRVFFRIDTEYVPLKNEYLRNCLGRSNVKIVRQALEDAGHLVCDHHYEQGCKSFGFKVGDQYAGVKYKTVEITSTIVKRAILKERKKQEIDITLAVHHWLRRWINDADFNTAAAQKIVQTADQQLHVLEMSQDYKRFSVCQFGRCHTVLTNLDKDFRRFVTFRNQQLQEVDLVNSQPFFLGVLVLHFYLNGGKVVNHKDIFRLQSLLSPNSNSSGGKEDITTHTLHYEGSPSQLLKPQDFMATFLDALALLENVTFPDDVRLYLKTVTDGQLYELFQDNGVSRKEAKEEMFRVLFGRSKCAKFQEMFPSVWEIIQTIKAKDYRHLAHLLQRLESFVMIECVVQRIMDRHPDLPVLTIHDSLLTCQPEKVRTILTEVFQEIGLMPKWKEKDQ